MFEDKRSADLISLLCRRVDELGESLAFRYLKNADFEKGTLEWSYAELDRRARQVAVVLQDRIAPGDRVLMLFPPGLDFIAGFFGCLYAGAIAVPAYPPDPNRLPQTLPRLRAIAANAGAKVLLSVGQIVEFAQPFAEMVPEFGAYHWIAVDQLPAGSESAARIAPVVSSRPAFLQYTSGSTGAARGVMVTHENVFANTQMIGHMVGIDPSVDSGLFWLPLFHDMGLFSVLSTITVGGSTTLMSPLAFLKDPLRWLRAISRFRATISAGPDFAYDLCARKATPRDLEELDLRSWRVAVSGAEPVRAATLDRFAAVFEPCGFSRETFAPSFGLAEATVLAATRQGRARAPIMSLDPEALARGSVVASESGPRHVGCGQAAVGSEFLIVDPTQREVLPDGRVGEIWIRGPHVASGYWERPEETAATFHGQLASGGPHYLRTGDLGFLHHGEVFIAGRLKDVIIVAGKNHYPQDIERTAEAASKALRAGCAAAFPVERDGREVVVLVAEAEGDSATLNAAAEAVRSAVSESHQLAIDEIVLIPPRTILKTSSGKIQRRACRDAWRAGELEVLLASRPSAEVPPTALSGTKILDEMISRLGAMKGTRDIRPDRSIATLGVSSLEAVQLTGELEKLVGFEIPTEIFFGHTLAEVAALLARGEQRSAGPSTIDFEAESALPSTLRPSGPPRTSDGPILLTGATGFLGSYLLAELLGRTKGEILCLVRAKDEASGLERLRKSLEHYGLFRTDAFSRVRVATGDLSQARFGLDEASFRALGDRVSSIVHCGAIVHWASAYADLKDTNVNGTRTVIELAAPRNVPIHYVSSIGVFPIGASEQSWFSEEGELSEPQHLALGYFQSKWIAEQQLHQARRRGFSVTVYRPGFITGDSRTGADAGADGQLFHAFLRGCIELGAVPRLDKVLDVVPVDFVASAIVALALRPEAQGRSFNLLNPKPLRQLDCYEQLRGMGYSLREAPYQVWREEVLALPQKNPHNPLAKFTAWYRNLGEKRMARFEQLTHERLPLDDRNTRTLLPSEVSCPPFDAKLLKTYVDSFIRRGLLPTPVKSDPAPRPAQSISFIESYEREDEKLIGLYEKAKYKQWNATSRIDWSIDLDPENPQELPDASLPIYRSEVFTRMTPKERANLRRHFQAWQLAQFMHGEQGALLCASKIVQDAPDLDSKLYAATQVTDEARHLEVFSRLLKEKFELSYPVSAPLKKLLDDILSDSRWDMTMLGMQVLIEGLALAAFGLIREQSKNALARSVNAYVMEDEARHVAFGSLVLASYYPQLTEKERDEREQFVVEACYLLRDRFRGDEVWETLGLPADQCRAHVENSGFLRTYRSQLFSRIVPVIRNIGLWGPRVQQAYGKMGILGFAQVDVASLAEQDEAQAEEIEASLRPRAARSEVA